MTVLNEGYMESSQSEARKGLMNLVETSLLPGIRVYRFGDSDQPGRWFTGPWWVSFSPFEALKQYAKDRGQPLTLTARQCLAVDLRWSRLDVLIEAVVKERLSAWSGTPQTQAPKQGSMYLGRLQPDRDVTQLYIPGLGEKDPSGSNRAIWQNAFIGPRFSHITSR
jgi:hypothetical protein